MLLKGDSSSAGPLKARLEYRYEPSRARAVYPRPTSIEFSPQGGSPEVLEVLLLEVSAELLPERLFSLDQLMSTNAHRISFDGTTRFFHARDGTRIPVRIVSHATPTSRSTLVLTRFALIAIALGLPIAWFVWTTLSGRRGPKAKT
jgi:hypothetical protein